MSKLARALVFGAMLAALNLAGMTAIAQAHASDPASQRHRALGQLELRADADHAVATQDHNSTDAVEQFRRGDPASQDQTAADAALRRVLARERFSIPRGTPAQLPTPVPDEASGQPGWLVASLGGLAAILALVAGVAVLAARRASHRVRAGQTPA
jgi:hypothetical protein